MVALAAHDIGTRSWLAMPDTVGMHLTYGEYKAPPHVQLISFLLMLNATKDPTSKLGAYTYVPRLGLSMPPGSGKQIATDTPVLTTTGWRRHGDLVVGDWVFHPDGHPVEIIQRHPDGVMAYEVETVDGDRIVCDGPHRWTLYDRGHPAWRTVTTEWLATQRVFSGGRARFQFPHVEAVQGPDVELPIDPYLLGVWLGDGSTSKGTLTLGPEDADNIVGFLLTDGHAVSGDTTHPASGVRHISIDGWHRALKRHGLLANKHIPDAYFAAPERQRRRLLEGLVDTDGHVEPRRGRVMYSGRDEHLVDQVRQLARSLGYRAHISKYVDTRPPHDLNGVMIRTDGITWTVQWTPHDGLGPGRLPRKQASTKATRRRNGIRAVRPVDPVAGNCITVDSPDGLYLVGYGLTPTHNSEIVDYWNSIWLLEREPKRRIVVASYSGALAQEQGKRVRNAIESSSRELRVRIMQDTRAADSWKTFAGGGMWTVGTGGTLTGRRASNMVIDDPHKNWAEAMSEKSQNDTWDWLRSTARTRLLPRSPMSVVQTRWNERDTIGRLTIDDANVAHDHPMKWMMVALPALADTDETIETVLGVEWCARLRSKGIVLPEWHREQGEALWPELEPGVPWFDEEEYGTIRTEVGELIWAGLYQQRPAPLEGTLFRRDRWQFADAPPLGAMTLVRRWDLAGTADASADATASVLMGHHHDTRTLWILDMTRDRLEPNDVEAHVHRVAEYDRERYGQVYIRVEREPGQSGKAQESSYLRNVLEGFPVEFIPSSGPKEVRAQPFAGQQLARNVTMVRRWDGVRFAIPAWWDWLIEECIVGSVEIMTPDGLRRADELGVGDLVLTHRGRFRPILAVSKRQAPSTITLTGKLLDPITLTPDHPVLAMNVGRTGQSYVERGVEWIPAGDLTVRPQVERVRKGVATSEVKAGPFVGLTMPIQRPDQVRPSLDLRRWYRVPDTKYTAVDDGEHVTTTHPLGACLRYQQPLDYRFGRLCGLYIAEGSFTRHQATWSFGSHEVELAREVKATLWARLNLDAQIVVRGSVRKVCVGVGGLADWFSTFGQSAVDKRVPAWAWEAPDEFVRGLLDGWYDGDAGTTVSRDLAWGVRLLATRFGAWPSITERSPRRAFIMRKAYDCRLAYQLAPYERPNGSRRSAVLGQQHLGFGVTDRTEGGSAEVFNFTVAEDESYVTTGGTLHNCAVFPNGQHDDMVDVCSLAYVDLLELVPRRSKARIKSSARQQLGF